MRKYPEEIRQFIRDHAAGVFNKDLAAMVNDRFGTSINATSMAHLKYQLGVRSGIDSKFLKGIRRSPATEFKKGHVPINKGIKGMFPNAGGPTRFKKGHRPHNYVPVGSEAKTSDGYWKVKIADPNIWKMKHILLWEQANGPIPKNMLLIFLDGNKDNCTLDNLSMISRAVNARKNQHHLTGANSELGKMAVMTAKLIAAMHEKRRMLK